MHTLSGGATSTRVTSQTNQPANAGLWSREIGTPGLSSTMFDPDRAVDLASTWRTGPSGPGDI